LVIKLDFREKLKPKNDSDVCCAVVKADMNSGVSKRPSADILPGQNHFPLTGDDNGEEMYLCSLTKTPKKLAGKPAPL
jgi:hypothetical protein